MTVASGVFISVGYVAPFYFRPRLPRDEPGTIRFRIACTVASCAVSWLPLWAVVQQERISGGERALPDIFELLGIRLTGLLPAVFYPLLLTVALFAGPFLMEVWESWDAPQMRTTPRSRFITWDLVALRNLVAGPITEEFVFRSCIAPLMLLEGWSPMRTVFVTPLFFGVAHVHHVIHRVVFLGSPLGPALLGAAVQFGYTTVFGWYATFLLLRTGHLAACITAHAFCNRMGFPNFGLMPHHPRSRSILTALAVGIAAFAIGIRPLTNPALYDKEAGAASFATVYCRVMAATGQVNVV